MIYKIHYAKIDLKGDVPCLEFTSIEEVRSFITSIVYPLKMVNEKVYLIAIKDAIIVTENGLLVEELFDGNLNSAYPFHEGEAVFIKEYPSYEDAYKGADSLSDNVERTNHENGNELTYKDSEGNSSKYTYDENGNILTYKTSEGYSSKYTYDENGKLLTYKTSEGYSIKYTYDENGKLLTYKDSEGNSSKYTYDENGNVLTHKTSEGYSYEYTYDENGNVLTYKDSEGNSRGFNVPD